MQLSRLTSVIDQICTAIFNPNYGIIEYLRKTSGSKDGSTCSAVADLLSFLSSFMTKRRKYPVLQVYALDLVVCHFFYLAISNLTPLFNHTIEPM